MESVESRIKKFNGKLKLLQDEQVYLESKRRNTIDMGASPRELQIRREIKYTRKCLSILVNGKKQQAISSLVERH